MAKNKRTIFLYLIVIGFIVTSCARKKLASDKNLYLRGMKNFEKEKYANAAEDFQTLEDNYPDSPYIAECRLRKADSYFYDEEYNDAIDSYERFLKFHPIHRESDRAQFNIGMSYFNELPSIDRDTDPAKKALSEFQRLSERYPKSSLNSDAKEKIDICRHNLAERDFYVGRFYLKRDRYIAARQRFQAILSQYMDLDLNPKALYYLAETYRLEDRLDEALIVYMRLFKEFPQDVEFYNKSRNRIEKLKK